MIMSQVTVPTEPQQQVVPGDLNLVTGNAGSGTGSLYIESSSANLFNAGNTHLNQTLIRLDNGGFNVDNTSGTNGVNFDITGSVAFRSDTSGIFSTSVGQLTLESTDTTTSGKVLVSSAGQGADALLLQTTDSASGQLRLTSAGQSATVPAIKLDATGVTGGGIDIESATSSTTVRAINLNATDTTNGSVQVTAQGNFASSVPAISLNAPNSTSGKILLTSGGSSTTTEAIELNASSATGGAVAINSAGPGTADGSIHINASNATSGVVKITGNGTGADSVNLQTPNGGQVFNAQGVISIQSADTTNGITIATDTPNVPVTVGTPGNTTTFLGNVITQGQFTEVRPTNTIFFDNIITVNTNPAVASGGDAGLAIRRQQQPNDTGLGDVVNRNIPRLRGAFQAGSATPGTLVLDESTANAADDFFNGWTIKITSGAGANQVRKISDFVSSTQTATLYVTADNTTEPSFTDGLDLATAPALGDTYELYNGNFATVIYNEVDDTLQHREAVIEPGSNAIVPGQFTKTDLGQTTVKPLSYSFVEISATGAVVTATLNGHGMVNGDKIRVTNPVTLTGTIASTVYEVSNVTTNTFQFTNSTSLTTDAESVIDIDLLDTSAIFVNKILPQDVGYGTVSVGGLISSQVVSLDTSNIADFATINVDDQDQGTWLVTVYNLSTATGAGGVFAVSKRSGDDGNVAIIVQERSADIHRIKLEWTDGQTLRLINRKVVPGGSTDDFFIKWT